MSEINLKKRKFSERNEDEDEGFVDKFSNLPLVLIHGILSKIPLKDAVKICVLSKGWRTIWGSRPFLYFHEINSGLNREAFLTYLEKSLDYYDKYGYSCCEVRELSLDMKVEESSHSEFLAKKCLDVAFRNKVQTFRFGIRMSEYSQCLHLRDASYFAATLDSLELHNCEVTNCSFVFPALKSLHLYNVWIEDDDFGNLIAGCPLIEGLSIDSCDKLSNIVVSNPTLKHFSLSYPRHGKTQIKSTNLQSFSLCSIYSEKQIVVINSVKTVKRLNFNKVHYQKKTFMRLIKKFPLLEKLDIYGCSGLSSLNVSQTNLTSFVLMKSNGIKEISIDAPKLKSLKYSGCLTSFTGIKSSKELELVELHVKPSKPDDIFGDCLISDGRWYIWLRNTLESFAHSKRLSLHCHDEKTILFPNELTVKLLPTIHGLKNLELHVLSCNTTTQKMLDRFIRILPGLKTFSLTTFDSFLKTVTELIELPQGGDVNGAFRLRKRLTGENWRAQANIDVQ